MNYLLDTNACIALMSPASNGVQDQFARTFHRGSSFFTSSIVAFELWYGVFKSARLAENTRRCETFFAGPVGIVPFEDGAAKIAGELRAKLEAVGKPIGAYDLLLAGQAMHHDMTLITANTKEFSRVKGLNWEDWSR
jgi:tRNA(fMet)-specific endonuclease VapC